MLRFLLPLLLIGALPLAICTAAQSLPIEQSAQTDDAASATPPVSAVFNCAALTDCAACISATFDWADFAVDVLPDEQSSSLALPSNKPCGWCMSSWKCLNGDNNAPSAPLYCKSVALAAQRQTGTPRASAHWTRSALLPLLIHVCVCVLRLIAISCVSLLQQQLEL